MEQLVIVASLTAADWVNVILGHVLLGFGGYLLIMYSRRIVYFAVPFLFPYAKEDNVWVLRLIGLTAWALLLYLDFYWLYLRWFG